MTRNCLNVMRKVAKASNLTTDEFLRRWMDTVRDPSDYDPYTGPDSKDPEVEGLYVEERMNNASKPEISYEGLRAIQDEDMANHEKAEDLNKALMYGAGGAMLGGGLGGLLFKKNRVLGALGGSVVGAGAGYGVHRIMNYLNSRQNA